MKNSEKAVEKWNESIWVKVGKRVHKLDLCRVGSCRGPDLERIAAARQKRPRRRERVDHLAAPFDFELLRHFTSVQVNEHDCEGEPESREWKAEGNSEIVRAVSLSLSRSPVFSTHHRHDRLENRQPIRRLLRTGRTHDRLRDDDRRMFVSLTVRLGAAHATLRQAPK